LGRTRRRWYPTDGDPHDELYLMTDDLYATVAKLQDRGVKFTRPLKDAGRGLLTRLELPGIRRELALYEPRHPRPLGSSGWRLPGCRIAACLALMGVRVNRPTRC
jgi:hypothetical protein